MGSRSISRRDVLKGGGAVAFAGLGVAALGLPFFDVDGAQQDPRSCRAGDESGADKRLLVSNWPGYIDPRRFEGNTRDLFERETGIEVRYTDDVNDNSEFYAKVRSQLGSCEEIDRDIMVLTDWMAARMIGLGWTQPLDKAKVPNLHKNLIKPLRGVQWDPDLEFHAPWQSGLTGIAYNAAETSEVGSFQDLITRPDLKGKITLLSEMRDTMAFMLRLEGADPDNFSQDDWDNAIDNISKVVDSGQVRSFTGNDYVQDLSNGNVLACEAWSGDVIQAQFDNPNIKFVVPEEGVALWSDNMMVPNLATHQANAEAWIDFYYDPVNAAKLASWVNYICPVKGAREAMEKIDPGLVDNTLIFPDEKMLNSTFDFMPLDDRQSIDYERDWTNVTAG